MTLESTLRPLTRVPMLGAFACTTIGVVVGQGIESVTAALWSVAMLILLGRTLGRGRGVFLAALGVFGALGAFSASMAEAPERTKIPTCRQESTGEWMATVERPVRRLPTDLGGGQKLFARLRWERCGSFWESRDETAWIRVPSAVPVFDGDTLRVHLEVGARSPRRNPTDPEHGNSASTVVARVRGHGIRVTPGTGLGARVDRLRFRVSQGLDEALSPPAAVLAKALVLGDRSGLGKARRLRWADVGIAHLLAVSGLHVGMVGGWTFAVVYLLIGWTPLGERFSIRRLASAASLVVIVGFCVWVGAPPSAVRATVMGGAVLVGVLVGRRTMVLNSLGLAGTWMLLIQPAALTEPGFLLSFGAVLGIVVVLRTLPETRRWWTTVLRKILAVGLASFAVSVVTLPVVAHFFGRVPWVSPVANLVAVPLATAALVPGAILCASSGMFAPWLARSVGRGFEFAVELLDRWVELLLTLPEATLYLQPMHAWAILGLSMGAFGAWRTRQWRWLSLGAVVLVLCLTRSGVEPSTDELLVMHPYVGQGDAGVVRFPTGHTLVFDAGGIVRGEWDPGERVVDPLLRRLGARRIDIAVVSHGDFDHVGGFLYLSQRWDVGELWWSGTGEPGSTLERVIANVREKGGSIRTVRELPEVMHRYGATIHVRSAEAVSDNDRSVVLRLTFGKRSHLFAGDIEIVAERELGPWLSQVDIVKVPHHGSATSSTARFIEATSPKLAVVSAGERNRFGLPAPEVLARYRARGTRVLQTSVHGMVTVATDGERWQVETYLK